MGANRSSIQLQKIHRIQAVAMAGTVTKKPAMNRTFSQFFIAFRNSFAIDHDTDPSRSQNPSAPVRVPALRARAPAPRHPATSSTPRPVHPPALALTDTPRDAAVLTRKLWNRLTASQMSDDS